MKITINNTPKEFEQESLTVRELLAALKFSFPMIIVKVNGHLVRKDAYDTELVRDGDRVDAIHLIGGGLS